MENHERVRDLDEEIKVNAAAHQIPPTNYNKP